MTSSMTESVTEPTADRGKMTTSEKAKRLVFELVETEKAYVQCLHRLIHAYLEPLRDATKLFPADVGEQLLSATVNIHKFQKTFADEIIDATGSDMPVINDDDNDSDDKQEPSAHLRVSDSDQVIA